MSQLPIPTHCTNRSQSLPIINSTTLTRYCFLDQHFLFWTLYELKQPLSLKAPSTCFTEADTVNYSPSLSSPCIEDIQSCYPTCSVNQTAWPGIQLLQTLCVCSHLPPGSNPTLVILTCSTDRQKDLCGK